MHDFNLGDPAQVADPLLLPALARLRDADPVYWSEVMNGWIITGYDEVAAAFKSRAITNDRVPAFAFTAIPPEQWATDIPDLWSGVENWIVNMDSPRHSRVRSLLLKAFTNKFVEGQRELIEQLCHEAVATAKARGTVDFMSEIAFPVPAKVILNFLGLPHTYMDKVRDWNHRVNLTVQTMSSRTTLLDGDRAIAELNAALREEIKLRQVEPRDDFLTRLIQASDDEGRLSEAELLSICQVLLFAGQDTTVNSLCLGLLAFLKHPDQAELFLSGEVDPLQAMNEVTRFTAMSTAQFKIAKDDFELGGKQIRAGQVIFIMMAGANHDPGKFPKPDSFDVTRSNLKEIMTFAPGIHLCIGHYLARMEMAIFFKTFLTAFKTIEVLDDPAVFQPNFVFRGLERLNIRVA